MSTAYRCDLCHEYDEGIPEHAPEEWTTADVRVQVTGIDFRVSPIFKVMTSTTRLDLCPKCVRRVTVEVLKEYGRAFGLQLQEAVRP